jgi:thioredoxin 1
MIKKFNGENFNNEIGTGTTLVDFYADWCGPCQMISPIVENIAKERTDITVIKVNVDENNSLAAQYGVLTIPTLITFKDGKEKTRAVGYRPKEDILAML